MFKIAAFNTLCIAIAGVALWVCFDTTTVRTVPVSVLQRELAKCPDATAVALLHSNKVAIAPCNGVYHRVEVVK